MMKLLLIPLLVHTSISLHAQGVRVQANVTCHEKTVRSGDTLTGGTVVQTARFYLSDFRFRKQGNEVFREPDSYHLIDMEYPESGQWTLNVQEFDEISFNLGIDSLTNVSGAYGGDLDPTKGMYWTWNSGYINVKLEGISPRSKGRNGEFGLHLGGYMPPHNTIFQFISPVNATHDIQIDLNICPVLEQTDWQGHFNVMSPSAEAVRLIRILGNSIRVYGK
jgi:hypothetical protein